MVKIFLDAGHGGTDPGASGNGLVEKNLTLDIIKRISSKLKANYENVDVALTRMNDVFVSLDDRCNLANKFGADVFLSVHINSATDPSALGFEDHIYNGTQDAKTVSYQNVMHNEILAAIKPFNIVDRGKKKSNFAVLRQTNMAAILTENLFITSPSDSAKLKQNDYLDAVANGHVVGLEKFLGLKKSQPPGQPPSPTGKLYKVQIGAFADPANADRLFKELIAKGYKPVIVEE